MSEFLFSSIRVIVLSTILLFIPIISFAKDGDVEMRINLSAHVIDSSVANLKATEWTIYNTSTISSSEPNKADAIVTKKIEQFTGAIKSLSLPSGDYIIKAKYGHAVAVKIIKFNDEVAEKFLNIKMIFDLGSLKLSSTIGNSSTIIEDDVTYIVRDVETGKIIIETDDVSVNYYLNQGDYNITAKYKDISVTEAKVKIIANNQNETNFIHKVGQVNLNIDNIKNDIKDLVPTWRILGSKDRIDKEISSTENAEIQLPIGDYQLMIEWDNHVYTREFEMLPAQIIEFKIPKE
ncbi:MAG: hypothetical protein HRU28_06880 [Rhizobiales bacterium]|nr:hypothetical protein [Hyphomicrobiales bacterium]